ncbi:MAG: peptide chain release factor N(5)-glutamine methyltransferase [Arenicellales bacterium]|nr:peptide chain release factor N(5)-glutamine methyltransferase [Arenicellales bacterium]
MPTIKNALVNAKNELKEISSTADLDARVLLQHCLEKDLAWVMSRADESLNQKHDECFNEYVHRRQRGEPVAYITGRKEFWSLTLAVNEKVLIPRPETEHLVERALVHLPVNERRQVVDLGTGSGAVGLAIAKERPLCEIIATDISPGALAVAAANARSLEVQNIQFAASDWFDALTGRTFDLIVCNPPYVAENDPCFQKGDLAHEPVHALRAGPDGLDALSVITALAGKHLRHNGWLVLEHGATQAEQVEQLLGKAGFEKISCHRDYAGFDRITEGCTNTQ